MADYYETLGLTRAASAMQIRAAYKRLAMEYHPDRNPGNPEAEEKFKAINEAYHVLSDPLKKSRYDARMNPGYESTTTHDDWYWQQVQRARYRQWQQAQQPRYVFDKEYFRIQGLAFLVFLVIAGFCFAVVHTISYFYEQQQAEAARQNRMLIANVNSLFGTGKVEEAFNLITSLQEQKPLVFEFVVARDSLIDVLRAQATASLEQQQFKEAAISFEMLLRYETPQRVETLEKLATAWFHAAEFEKASVVLKQVYALQPWNIEVIYELGAIHYTYLHNPREALNYFTLARTIFRDNLTEIYGEAFEVVMDPRYTPEIYYQMFLARARCNKELRNFAEMEKDCSWAIFLRPGYPEPYLLRVEAKAANHSYGICKDVLEAKKLGANVTRLQARYCQVADR